MLHYLMLKLPAKMQPIILKSPKPYIITICNATNNNITIATIQNTKTNKSETYSFTSLDLVNFDL